VASIDGQVEEGPTSATMDLGGKGATGGARLGLTDQGAAIVTVSSPMMTCSTNRPGMAGSKAARLIGASSGTKQRALHALLGCYCSRRAAPARFVRESRDAMS